MTTGDWEYVDGTYITTWAGTGLATTCGPVMWTVPNYGLPLQDDQIPQEERKKLMNIYVVFLVDAMENDIIRQEFIIARTEKDATASMSLEKTLAKAVSKGEFAIVSYHLGSFEPKEVALVKNI